MGLILELALGAVLELIPEIFPAISAENVYDAWLQMAACLLQNTDRRWFICCCWKSVGSKRASRAECPNLCGDFMFWHLKWIFELSLVVTTNKMSFVQVFHPKDNDELFEG